MKKIVLSLIFIIGLSFCYSNFIFAKSIILNVKYSDDISIGLSYISKCPPNPDKNFIYNVTGLCTSTGWDDPGSSCSKQYVFTVNTNELHYFTIKKTDFATHFTPAITFNETSNYPDAISVYIWYTSVLFNVNGTYYIISNLYTDPPGIVASK